MKVPERTNDGVARPDWLDRQMRERTWRIAEDFLAFARDASEFIKEGYHVKFGYLDAARYFEDRLGLRWRSVRRYLSVMDGIDRLPEEDRKEAGVALAKLGVHKSAVLAPLLGRDGVDWRGAVEQAGAATIDAVQVWVSEQLGAKPRGAAVPEEERFLHRLLALLPDEEDLLDEVRAVFALGAEIGETRNTTAIFLYLCREVRNGWELLAERKRRDRVN